MPQMGALSKMEQRIFVSGILLGGTKSDYFNVIERDYNMGSGFSIKSKTQLDFGRFGRIMLNAKYFRLYTWKGYEKYTTEELQEFADGTRDLHYLNVQGDNSNAALLVLNPIFEFHVAKQWAVNLSGTYYWRRTHYNYYYENNVLKEDSNVKAKTFEVKLGVTCRL
jgi:hypothetical protein